jgi:predicted PurR-regulated permease PerM
MTDARTVDPQFHLPARRVIGLAILAAIVFWFARPVIAPFLVAALIAYAFDPLVDAVQTRTGRSRYVVVFVAVGISVAILVLVAALAAGPAIREAQLLIASGPAAIETALRQILGSDSVTVGDRTITVEELAAQAQAAISKLLQTPEGALRVAEQILHSTLDIVLTIIVTFYLLLDGDRFAGTALRFLQPADRSQMARVGGRIHVVLGHWLRGQLVLIAFVAIVVWFVLGPIMGIPHSTALGILTGVLEIIPLVGPLVAGLVVAIVALSAGGIGLAVVAVVFLFVLRQIEDAVVMPLVVGRAVHLHPLVALFAVVVGTTAFGVLGTFLAVPVAAAVNVALHEFFPEELGASPGMPPAAATVTPAADPPTGASADE